MEQYFITPPENKGHGNNSLNKENPRSKMICPEERTLGSDTRILVPSVSFLIGPKAHRRIFDRA